MIGTIIMGLIASGISIAVLKGIEKFERVQRFFSNQNLLIATLLVWTIIGFLSSEDFNERCGCIYNSRNILSIDYIIYSSISMILFGLAWISKTKFRIGFIFLEFAYWLFKLFFLKSGYEGGLGIPIFNLYDFIGLFFRLWIIGLIININYKVYLVPIISACVIGTKLEVNPCGKNILYYDLIHPILEKRITEKLTGKWIGSAKASFGIKYYDSSDSIDSGNGYLKSDKNDTVQLYLYDNEEDFNICASKYDTVINIIKENVVFEFKDNLLFISHFDNDFDSKYYIEWTDVEAERIVYYPDKLRAMNLESVSFDEWDKKSYGDSIGKYENEVEILQLNKVYCKLRVKNKFLLNLKRKEK
jgi:hypothetical protein